MVVHIPSETTNFKQKVKETPNKNGSSSIAVKKKNTKTATTKESVTIGEKV